MKLVRLQQLTVYYIFPQTQEESDTWYKHPDDIITPLNLEGRNAFMAGMMKTI